ncbi:MAG: peptidyl-prolyl cis-trans isomerase, partial [Gemmatimonadota bacterium]
MISVRALPALASWLLVVALSAIPAAAQSTMVRVQTSVGVIDVALYDTAAPVTVTNFLGYVH